MTNTTNKTTLARRTGEDGNNTIEEMSTEFSVNNVVGWQISEEQSCVKIFQLSTAAGSNSALISHGETTAEIQLQKRTLRYFKQVKYLGKI